MVNFNTPLPEISNSNPIIEGYQAGQNIQANNLKILGAQEELRSQQLKREQLTAIQALSKAAVVGDGQALAQLAAISPDTAKGIRDYNNYKITRAGQLWQGVTTAPRPMREKLYQSAINQYKSEFGEIPNVPANYSPEAESYLKSLVTQSRDVEKVAEEEFQRPLQNAKVASEYLDQQKKKEEIFALKDERERVKASGLSPAAYKKTQEALGEAAANESLIKAGYQPKLSGEGAKVLTIAEDGINSISNIKNIIFNTKGELKGDANKILGGSSFLPSILESKDQQAFTLARKNLNDLIGRLRSGGAINKDELETYKDLVPKYGDKPETIKKKLDQLENNFATLGKSILGTSSFGKQVGGSGNDPLGIR